MAIGHHDRQGVTLTMATALSRRLDKHIDFRRCQIFAGSPALGIRSPAWRLTRNSLTINCSQNNVWRHLCNPSETLGIPRDGVRVCTHFTSFMNRSAGRSRPSSSGFAPESARVGEPLDPASGAAIAPTAQGRTSRHGRWLVRAAVAAVPGGSWGCLAFRTDELGIRPLLLNVKKFIEIFQERQATAPYRSSIDPPQNFVLNFYLLKRMLNNAFGRSHNGGTGQRFGVLLCGTRRR